MTALLRTLLLAAALTTSSHATAAVIDAGAERFDVPDAPSASGGIESQSLGQPRRVLSSGAAEVGANSDDRSAAGSAFGSLRRDAWQVFSALAVVLGLLFLVRTMLMRSALRIAGGTRPSGVVEILARYPVARGQHLVLLKLARRVLLLHQSGSAMTTLAELSDRDEVASLLGRIEAGSTSPREAARFRTLLRQFSTEHDAAAPSVDHTGIRDAWSGDNQIVDLTKRRRGGLAGLFSPSPRSGAR